MRTVVAWPVMLSLLVPPYLILVQAITPFLMQVDVVFGVRLPSDRVRDPVVRAVRRRYWLGLGALAAVGGAAGGLPAPAGLALVGVVTTGTTAAAGFVNMALAHTALEHAKQGERWMAPYRQVTVASLDHESEPLTGLGIPGWVALGVVLATMVSVVERYPSLPTRFPVHFGLNGDPNRYTVKSVSAATELLLPYGAAVLLLALARPVRRVRRDLDPVRPDASYRQQAVFARRNQLLMEAMALLVAVEGLVVSLSVLRLLDLRSVWALGVTLFPVGVFVAAVLVVAIRTGQSGARVAVAEAPDQPGVVHRDDDRYWWAGQVYVNHDDPAWLVPKRFGYGYTVNFGHRHGWLVLAILLLFIAAGPILATLASH